MAVPPEFIEDLRQRVPLSDIVGRRIKRYVKVAVSVDYALSFRKNAIFFGC